LENLGKNIKHLRKLLDYKQRELGGFIGVTTSMVSSYEIGRNIPSLEILIKLRNIFKVDLESLVFKKIWNGEPFTPLGSPPPELKVEELKALQDAMRLLREELNKYYDSLK